MDILSELLRLAQVVLGIGLVIFVHELGHFLAARLCGVRVVTFSLGFGPKLVGWRRGGTLYQVAAFPLGGYCRMLGEEYHREDGPPSSDDLLSKSIGQRFLIYSGGVLMNVVFALVVFPILFHFGMPFTTPELGDPIPGSPAWEARLPAGARVLAVNGRRVLSFDHIGSEIALGDPDETVLTLEDPATHDVHDVRLQPEFQQGLGYSTIGVLPPADLDAQGRLAIEVDPGSPAAKAGLETGQRVASVDGGLPGMPLADQIGILRAQGGPITLHVVDPSGEGGTHAVTVAPQDSKEPSPPRVGISPVRDLVTGVRPSPTTEALGLREGDRVRTVAGQRILRIGDFERALLAADGPVQVVVRRGRQDATLGAPALTRDEKLALASDVALSQDLDSTVILPQPGEPAALAGVLAEDRILAVDGTSTEAWKDIIPLVQSAAREGRPAVFAIERVGADGKPTYPKVAVEPKGLPAPEYGFAPRADQYVYRAGSTVQAIGVGAFCSWKFLEDTWLTLKRIVLGQVDANVAVGGPIQIGRVSYELAERGWATFFFFLCIISVNLAFINVLPIPVLDGGHLFFLLIEKIKGSPVSDRVLGYSQLVGVVLILSLMVFVTYNDLLRLIAE